jgi:hypothetical protein
MKKEKTVFELTTLEYRDEKPKYPLFKIRRQHKGFFSDLAEAEQGMRAFIEDEKQYRDPLLQGIFGFLIEEHVLDALTYHVETKSKRTYLPDGTPWEECPVSDMNGKDGNLERLTGRPPEKIRFKQGDLVEVLCFSWVSLKIVGNLPRTPEEVQEMYEHSPELRFAQNPSNDCYCTLDRDGYHSYPASVDLFPVRFKVSKALRQKFLNFLNDEYYSYRAEFDDFKKEDETMNKENRKHIEQKNGKLTKKIVSLYDKSIDFHTRLDFFNREIQKLFNKAELLCKLVREKYPHLDTTVSGQAESKRSIKGEVIEQ